MKSESNTKEPKIGVVVLNYRTYEDTLACVESLKKQDYSDYHIIVVENGSNNESADVLKDAFDEDDRVTLICSDVNLGFARGNNLGIRFAAEKLSCDFIFVLNSDTIVPEGVFRVIVSAYREDVGVISPSVCNVQGRRMPPSENCDDIDRQAKIRTKGLYLARFLNLPIVHTAYSLYSGKKKSVAPPEQEWDENDIKEYVLQGCSYFLTPSFFRYYTQLFPETFLYWEEIDILLYLKKVGLKSIFVTTPPIVHKEAGSTANMFTDREHEKRKLRFSFDSYKKSKKMFRMEYDEIRSRFC